MNSCKVAIDKVTSFHKGVAYVDFATNEDAKNAVKYMDGGRFLIIISYLQYHILSIICFKLAEITNGNELENTKYGQKIG